MEDQISGRTTNAVERWSTENIHSSYKHSWFYSALLRILTWSSDTICVHNLWCHHSLAWPRAIASQLLRWTSFLAELQDISGCLYCQHWELTFCFGLSQNVPLDFRLPCELQRSPKAKQLAKYRCWIFSCCFLASKPKTVPIEPTQLSGGMWLHHAPVSQQRTVTGIHRITESVTSRLTPQPVLSFTPLHSCDESSQLLIKFGDRILPKEQNFIENFRGALLVTETQWIDVSFCGDWGRFSVFLGWSWNSNGCLLVRSDLCGTEPGPRVLDSATSQPEQLPLPLLPLADLSPARTSTVRVQGQVMNWIQCWTLTWVKN